MKFIAQLQKEKRDPRYLQLFLLGSFLCYGMIFLQWSTNWYVYGSALLSVGLTQIIWSISKDTSFHSTKSALISGLGLCLLLKVDSAWVMWLAGIVTISSKFLFRRRGKHLFNPTNFGIVAIVFLDLGWIDPGQWGQGDATIALIVLGAAGILLRVKRWDLSISFLVTLFLLESSRIIFYLGWDWPVLFHRFSSGTILLFAFFMITDPKTTPNSRQGRLCWGCLIALLSFILGQFYYLYEAPLIALFILSLTTPLFDFLFMAERFMWNPKTQKL